MFQRYDDKGNITCDLCDQPAILNFQQLWMVFGCKDGGYTDTVIMKEYPEPRGDNNRHLCDEHALQEFGDRGLRGRFYTGSEGEEHRKADIALLNQCEETVYNLAK